MKKFFHFVALLSSLAVLSNFMSCSDDSSDDSSSTVNGPGSLYSSNAPDISITYNMNYEGAEATVRTEKGNSYIPLETFEREGYSLIGWADSADAEEVKYESGSKVKVLESDRTFYAIWTDSPTRTITLNSNTDAPEEKVYYFGTYTFAVPANTFTRDGYEFIGWGTSKTDTEVTYFDCESASQNELTLYAVWKTKSELSSSLKIIFHSNDGKNKTYYQYDPSIYDTLLPNAFVRPGYSFQGWAENANATESLYDNKQRVPTTFFIDKTDLNLYAVWADSSKLSITYKRNHSSDDTESFTEEVAVADDKATIKVADCSWEPESDDSAFACWKADGVARYPGETIEFEGEDRQITYKALWISKSGSFTKTTTYYRNSSSSDSETVVSYYDWGKQDEVALKACPWTVEGKKFVGWAKYSSSTTADYKEYERLSWSKLSSSYYAIWE
ncbi:MAG: InlB B-repeat-containing protein [Treponema sp.]|nr:InlB B-repeat-containing protein [Treponema sp.]